MADPTSPSPYSENKKFEPKVKVELNPPRDTLITLEELSKCDGKDNTPQYRSTTQARNTHCAGCAAHPQCLSGLKGKTGG